MIVREDIFDQTEQGLRIEMPMLSELEALPSADPATFPAVHIEDGGQQPIPGEAGMQYYELTLTLVGYEIGASRREAWRKLNALYADTIRAMFATYQAVPLQGAADEIREGGLRYFTAALASDWRMSFEQDFIISFATVRGDPENRGV